MKTMHIRYLISEVKLLFDGEEDNVTIRETMDMLQLTVEMIKQITIYP